MIWYFLMRKLFRKAVDNVITDPLYADGTPVNTDWSALDGPERTEERYENTLTIDSFLAFIKRLGQCLDKPLQQSQVEILEHRVNALRSGNNFKVVYTVVQAGEVTNLEITTFRPSRDVYELSIRGRGPAMKIIAAELHTIASQTAK